MNKLIKTGVALLAFLAPVVAHAADDQGPAWFSHLPLAEAPEGQAVTIEARIARAWQATMEIRYRTIGDVTWRAETFQRGTQEGEYRATIPAEAVRAPGFEYFILGAAKDGASRGHFASEVDPHQVMVYEDSTTVLRNVELARVHGRRARARTSFEIVDFGQRIGRNPMGADQTFNDYYYRIDADFTYRVLRLPLYSLRFGYSRLFGDTPGFVRHDDPSMPDRITQQTADCSLAGGCNDSIDAGFRVSGWFEMRLRATSLIDVDGRGIVAATVNGFNVGARFEGRIGPETGSHVALGWEGVVDTGYDVFLRLGWDTVPNFPMAATVSITDMPSPNREAAIRLIYDVAYPLENGFKIGARVGYQARDRKVGGLAAGLNLALEF